MTEPSSKLVNMIYVNLLREDVQKHILKMTERETEKGDIGKPAMEVARILAQALVDAKNS